MIKKQTKSRDSFIRSLDPICIYISTDLNIISRELVMYERERCRKEEKVFTPCRDEASVIRIINKVASNEDQRLEYNITDNATEHDILFRIHN